MCFRFGAVLLAFGTVLAFVPQKASAQCSHTYEAPINTYFCQEGWTCTDYGCLNCPECDTNCSCDHNVMCFCNDRTLFLYSCWSQGCGGGVGKLQHGGAGATTSVAQQLPACEPSRVALRRSK